MTFTGVPGQQKPCQLLAFIQDNPNQPIPEKYLPMSLINLLEHLPDWLCKSHSSAQLQTPLTTPTRYTNCSAQTNCLIINYIVSVSTFCSIEEDGWMTSCIASEIVCSVDSGRHKGSRLSTHKLSTMSCKCDTSVSIVNSWSCCHKQSLVQPSLFTTLPYSSCLRSYPTTP